MKLLDAIALNRRPVPDAARSFEASLVCGFTPLHLQTFLSAFLRNRFPDRRVHLATGLYNDLLGSLDHLAHSSVDAGIVVLEWPDLDPRLGFRQLGG